MSVKNITTTTKKMEVRKVIIKLRDGTLLKGRINIHADIEGDVDTHKFRRTSDFFKNSAKFFTVFNVTFQGLENKTIFVNKSDVIWACEDDNQSLDADSSQNGRGGDMDSIRNKFMKKRPLK